MTDTKLDADSKMCKMKYFSEVIDHWGHEKLTSNKNNVNSGADYKQVQEYLR